MPSPHRAPRWAWCCAFLAVVLAKASVENAAPDRCPGGAVGEHVWMVERETADGTFNVPVHPRAADLDCYIRTKWRKLVLSDSACAVAGSTRPACPEKKIVAVTVHGELSRLDPNTTITTKVVKPFVAGGYEVVVFLSLQAVRPKLPGSWHNARFNHFPAYSDAEQRVVLERFTAAFLDSGAAAVALHLYDLTGSPPMMPSLCTGGPGHGHANRFCTAWTSYPLHCLVHSNMWRDVERFEHDQGRQIDLLFKMRADTFWLRPVELPQAVHLSQVSVMKCFNWNGYNDKVALVPRRYAAPWMRLLEAYFNQTYAGYKNSETLLKMIAAQNNIPVTEWKTYLGFRDYYWWITNTRGSLGCFPKNYAGVSSNGACVECFRQGECAHVGARLCDTSVLNRRRAF